MLSCYVVNSNTNDVLFNLLQFVPSISDAVMPVLRMNNGVIGINFIYGFIVQCCNLCRINFLLIMLFKRDVKKSIHQM